MPFTDRLANNMTPKRVYALCKLVAYQEMDRQELFDYLQPQGKLSQKSQNTASSVYSLAKNGGLIAEEDGKVRLLIAEEDIQTIASFRRAISERVFSQPELIFCIFTSWYLARGNRVYGETSKDLEKAFNREINPETQNIYNDTNITAWKTWAAFLGFGFIHDGILIPSVHVRIKDCLTLDNELERGKSILFSDFMGWLKEKCPELDGGEIYRQSKGATEYGEKELSLGLSTGLRVLHDRGDIRLIYQADAPDFWHLQPVSTHEIIDTVSEIIIRGDRQ